MSQKNKFAYIIILIAIVGAGFYFFQQNKEKPITETQIEENQNSVTQMQTFSNTNYSFEYPQNYVVKKEIEPERIDVVGKNGKLSIFQLKSPSGERVTDFGFGGTDAEKIPEKLKIIENEQTWFNVWLYYEPSDKTTEEELLAIYDSIELK
ncbi:hypothetical protein KKG71_04285 [Patescibacteria group bacterium]|nr:hypothetical protein [Patescibacteria group bacterium]